VSYPTLGAPTQDLIRHEAQQRAKARVLQGPSDYEDALEMEIVMGQFRCRLSFMTNQAMSSFVIRNSTAPAPYSESGSNPSMSNETGSSSMTSLGSASE